MASINGNNNLHVNRSVQFVSLDTHPANNALVLTYEISVVVSDVNSKRELSRRNKRDQMLINVPSLEELIAANKSAINLQELSEQILRKCPILLTGQKQQQGTQLLEEIQLHLLYLVNRRQAQINNPNVRDASSPANSRPQSSLMANRNLRPGSRLGQHKRLLSARIPSPGVNSIGSDVYGYLLAKDSIANESDHLEYFLLELDERLSRSFGETQQQRPSMDKLDQYLEGLYGDTNEKLMSIGNLRELSKLDESLPAMSSNKLLVCATSRTLRDLNTSTEDDSTTLMISESILYCLLRMSSFSDTYLQLSVSDSQMDTLRVVVDKLSDQVELLKSDEDRLSHNLVDRHYYQLRSLLLIVANTLNLNMQMQSVEQVRGKKLLYQNEKFTSSLMSLFMLTSRALSIEIKITAASEDDAERVAFASSISKPLERLVSLLELQVHILRILSTSREIITQLKAKSKQTNEFSTCVINLLNTLQLARPGSGTSATSGQPTNLVLRDQQTLNVIYQLEIDILKLTNNFINYQYLRAKLIKRNLLKCVLRNLVVFLANNNNGNKQSLSLFGKSSVLLVPFRCLYELSGEATIKNELYKSKIVIKCLLDYLVNEVADFQRQLDSTTKDDQQVTMVIEPNCAGHYIYGLWINLTSRPEAPIYSLKSASSTTESSQDYNSQLRGQLGEFVSFVVSNLKLFVNSTAKYRDTLTQSQQMIYLQLKILRNLTQFTRDPLDVQLDVCINQLAQLTSKLLDIPLETIDCCPFAVETLAATGNLLELEWRLRGPSRAENEDDLDLLPSKQLMGLFEKLVQSNLMSLNLVDGEDYDDLLLVALNFIGSLSKTREICLVSEESDDTKTSAQIIKTKWIEMSNQLLDTKPSDIEMSISCLFSLAHLMNHANFLESLAKDMDVASSNSNLERKLEQLVKKLAELLLSGNNSIVRLSSLLLNRLRQLEEQQSINESHVFAKRFTIYNDKWLAAIKSSRNQEELSSMGAKLSGSLRSPQSSELIFSDQDDEFNMIEGSATLRAVDSQSSSSGGSGDLMGPKSSGQHYNRAHASANSRLIFDELEEDEDNSDDDEDDDEASRVLAASGDDDDEAEMKRKLICDLNVIDPQSMFKHLVRD